MTLGLGLIGCGAIGTVLAEAIDKGQAGDACLVMIYDIMMEKCRILSQKLKNKPKIAEKFNDLLECREIELVIEAASQEAVRQYAQKVLKAGKDLMIMSVGALVDSKLFQEISGFAKENGRKVYIPSGAIAGVDGVKASAIGKIKSVTLTTRKPIERLERLESIRNEVKEKKGSGRRGKPKILYEGPAVEACKLFPANINVAATLSLAGVGPERTQVKIIADPSIDRNIHEVKVKGEFGELKVSLENVPLADNPKTSHLAALSAIATLKKISEPIIIGT